MRLRVVLASFGAVTGLAAPAHADPGGGGPNADASFLAELERAGISYGSTANAIAAGRRACDLMNQGQQEDDVISSLTADNPGFTTPSATQFTTIAASAYCPQLLGNSPPPPNQTSPPQSWFVDLPPLPAAP
jgi:uncharacterized protein DUF732